MKSIPADENMARFVFYLFFTAHKFSVLGFFVRINSSSFLFTHIDDDFDNGVLRLAVSSRLELSEDVGVS